MQKILEKKKEVFVGVAIAALTLVVISVWNLWSAGYVGEQEEVIVPPVVTCAYRHALTGVCLDHDPYAGALPPVYAVMIENSRDAWPQAGLLESFLVFEVPTEANIPRLLAFYHGIDQNVDKIGPVRSARPYFIDLATPFQSLYAHVGGSPAAVEFLKSTASRVFNLDEMANQYQFWRDSSRAMPHNVYTATDLLAQGLAKRHPEKTEWTYPTYTFKDDAPSGLAQDFIVEFGAPSYRVTWKYDQENNAYVRWQNSHEHTMENGDVVRANNVIVMVAEIDVLDSVGRLAIETVGEGEARVMQDGKIIQATWKRASTDELVRFYDEMNSEIALNGGATWVEVVPTLDDYFFEIVVAE